MVQCSWRAFFFGGEDPHRFASPQVRWPLLPLSFLAYRWLFALYQVVAFTLIAEHYCMFCDRGVFFTYVTDWAFISLVAYSMWSALAATNWHMKGKHLLEEKETAGSKFVRKNSRALSTPAKQVESASAAPTGALHHTPWYFKVSWCLQVQACSVNFVITLLYWLIIYTPGGEAKIDYFNIASHGIGVVLLLVDFLLVANPCRLFHLIYAVAYAVVYFLFTYVYYVLGGRNPGRGTAIYVGSLDWGELPTDTLILALLGSLVAAPISHGVFFAIHLLKIAFGRCCKCCNFSPS